MGRLLGVMGIQDKGAVALVRHAYVAPTRRGRAVGTRLLRHVQGLADKPILIGTLGGCVVGHRVLSAERIPPSSRTATKSACSGHTGRSPRDRSRRRSSLPMDDGWRPNGELRRTADGPLSDPSLGGLPTAMRTEKTSARCEGVRLSINRDGKEVARAYLFLMWNSLHEAPFGLLEDVYVDEAVRGFRSGTEIRKCRGCRGERPRLLQTGRNKPICEAEGS